MGAITYYVCYPVFFQIYSVSKWGFLILLALCALTFAQMFSAICDENYLSLDVQTWLSKGHDGLEVSEGKT